MSTDPHTLPENLPVPIDDGACDHLADAPLPPLALPCTNGSSLNLAQLCSRPTVLFFYPRTGIPGHPPSLGFQGETWDSIPGARGCTPQSCGFRDLYSQFQSLGVNVYGVSTNTTTFQFDFKTRNHIPFEFLSDSSLWLTRAMRLPTFEFPETSGGPTTMLQRMAWFADKGRISKIWYPVFPPDKNAATVLKWLNTQHSKQLAIEVRPKTEADSEFIKAELQKHWHNTQIWSLGNIFDADQIPALIAWRDGQRIGLLTYQLHVGGRQLEVVTLSAANNGNGAGTALLRHIADLAKSHGCFRAFLTTTNDNLNAIGFYQKRGWTMVRYHAGSMDRARILKPTIPLIGDNNIPLKDELEFELSFIAPPQARKEGVH